jgi:phosphohistidine phosphatase
MWLYIVRHAIAAPHGTPGMRDEDRLLTEEGIKKMQQAAAGLLALEYVPDIVLTSPLPRAKQTADILLKVLGKGIPLEILPALAPSGARAEVYRSLREHGRKSGRLMLVGHQPSLGQIAGEIAWGSTENWVELKKGGACAIEVEELRGVPKGRMISLLTPLMLRKIAR